MFHHGVGESLVILGEMIRSRINRLLDRVTVSQREHPEVIATISSAIVDGDISAVRTPEGVNQISYCRELRENTVSGSDRQREKTIRTRARQCCVKHLHRISLVWRE